jgi:hypothetical protein
VGFKELFDKVLDRAEQREAAVVMLELTCGAGLYVMFKVGH